MPAINEVLEGRLYLTVGEERVFAIDVTGIKVNGVQIVPASPVVTAYDLSNNTNVTSTVLPTNNPTISDPNINLPLFKAFSAGKVYRIVVVFTNGSTEKFVRWIEVYISAVTD